MERQPTLHGPRLDLRPLTAADEQALFEAAADPLIWELHPQSDRYKPEVFKKFFAEALASGGALAIVERQSAKIIGSSRFYDHMPDQSSVVIGYTFLTRAYWGGAYNLELKRLMVNHALKFIKTIYFHVGLGNLRSQRALAKIGAENTGIQEIPVSYAPPKKSYVYKLEHGL